MNCWRMRQVLCWQQSILHRTEWISTICRKGWRHELIHSVPWLLSLGNMSELMTIFLLGSLNIAPRLWPPGRTLLPSFITDSLDRQAAGSFEQKKSLSPVFLIFRNGRDAPHEHTFQSARPWIDIVPFLLALPAFFANQSNAYLLCATCHLPSTMEKRGYGYAIWGGVSSVINDFMILKTRSKESGQMAAKRVSSSSAASVWEVTDGYWMTSMTVSSPASIILVDSTTSLACDWQAPLCLCRRSTRCIVPDLVESYLY